MKQEPNTPDTTEYAVWQYFDYHAEYIRGYRTGMDAAKKLQDELYANNRSTLTTFEIREKLK